MLFLRPPEGDIIGSLVDFAWSSLRKEGADFDTPLVFEGSIGIAK